MEGLGKEEELRVTLALVTQEKTGVMSKDRGIREQVRKGR